MLNFFVLVKDQFLLRYINNLFIYKDDITYIAILKLFELIIFFLGFVYINLMVRENHFAWLIGGFNCLVLTVIWYNKGVWGNVLLYSFYVCNASYAFIKWRKKDTNNEAVVKLKWSKWYNIVIQLCLVALLIYVLTKIVNLLSIKYGLASNYTIWGVFLLVFSLYSLILQVNKNIESWFYFTIVDAVVTILYIKTGLYCLALVKGYMTIMSGYGFIRWIIKYNKNTNLAKQEK